MRQIHCGRFDRPQTQTTPIRSSCHIANQAERSQHQQINHPSCTDCITGSMLTNQVLLTLLIVLFCWLNDIDKTWASSPSSTVCCRWASSLMAARPSRLDASGFSIIPNARQRQQQLPPSYSIQDECRGLHSSAPSSSASPSSILHRHRGGAVVSERVKTMTARQMELFK
jgi:hypothetical protein